MISDDDGHPIFRSFVYMNINISFIFFSIAVFINGLLKFLLSNNLINYQLSNSNPLWHFFILLLISTLYTYFRFFFKKDINFYETKYKEHWLNKYFFGFVLYLVPLLFFIIGPTITVFLFGGTSFGYEFAGILN